MRDLIGLLTTFTGRISRRQWWIGLLAIAVAEIAGAMVINRDYFFADERPPPSWLETVWQIALVGPKTAIIVKRFNDRGWPWWLGYVFVPLAVARSVGPHVSEWISPVAPTQSLTLVLMLPLLAYGLFAFIDNGFSRGTDGPNAYGPDPLAKSDQPT